MGGNKIVPLWVIRVKDMRHLRQFLPLRRLVADDAQIGKGGFNVVITDINFLGLRSPLPLPLLLHLPQQFPRPPLRPQADALAGAFRIGKWRKSLAEIICLMFLTAYTPGAHSRVMPSRIQTVTIWICSVCGHEWQSQDHLGKPIRCAKCKTPYWDRPKKSARKGKD
jgi:hypothetical protein